MRSYVRLAPLLAAMTLFLLFAPVVTPIVAQDPPTNAHPQEQSSKPADQKVAPPAETPKEESSVTDHTIHIDGQTISYKAVASMTFIRDEKGEPTALMFSIAYTRSDAKDVSQRPIAFLYNGGPGSSSAWLHMGAFGPRRVTTANASATPPPPYAVEENSHCLLDKADLVFIDPVGTGYSHAVGKAQDKDFWGVDSDVQSIGQFINTYISRNNRWNSPKYLIGESYGTFRSAALANYLQSNDGIYLNGIVLMSTVLDMDTLSFNPGEDISYILYLPSYASTAWYHKALKDPPGDLNEFLKEARQFASGEYAGALMKGSTLSDSEKATVAQKLARFTGLSEDYLMKANLRVSLSQFEAELQRSQGLITGRLDARYSGAMVDRLSEHAEYDPLLAATTGPFTAAFNTYVRDELKFSQDRKYELLSGRPADQWDWKHRGGGGFPGSPNVERDLVQALVANPHLEVQVENGLFDLATPFYATEYTMNHLELPASLVKNIHMEYYDAGHMMYLVNESLAKLKDNIAAFIDTAAKH
jgi:carboxypeptidase C (cathepsin A)